MEKRGSSGGACTRRGGERWRPRRPIRLGREAYVAGEPFLLTICTAGRQSLLKPQHYGRQVYEAILVAAEKTGATLWCAVVMPEHVHLLLHAPAGRDPLDTAACFKRLATIAVRKAGYKAESFWQRRIHDRGIRTNFGNDLGAAIRYVLSNPVRRALVSSWEQWPLSYVHPEIELSSV